MANSKYTAQEMRDKATELQESADEISRDAVEEGDCTYKPLCKADAREIETITNMLSQAAEMRERAYAVIAKARKANETQTSFGCRTCVENYIKEINYILHGDAWKEEK